MAKKVMLSFPDEFLVEVDRIARKEHRSRSELVREALRFYIGTHEEQAKPGTRHLVRRAIKVQDRLSSMAPGTDQDSTTDIRQWREAHG